LVLEYKFFFKLVDLLSRATIKVYKNEALKTCEIDYFSTRDNDNFKAHKVREGGNS